MDLFEKLKSRYEKGWITKETLRGYVLIELKRPGKGITPEQYEEITGKPYNDPESEETGE